MVKDARRSTESEVRHLIDLVMALIARHNDRVLHVQDNRSRFRRYDDALDEEAP